MSAADELAAAKGWQHLRAVVLHRDSYLCQICREVEATEADHIWPKSKGGPDLMENLQAACGPCNRSKGNSVSFATATALQLNWLASFQATVVANAQWELAQTVAAIEIVERGGACLNDLASDGKLDQDMFNDASRRVMDSMQNPFLGWVRSAANPAPAVQP